MEDCDKIREETELCSQEELRQQQSQNQEDTFIWDDQSQLYYHARSGFYHDPNAGWYYSTSDGYYYKFEDGNYILLDTYNKDHQLETEKQGESAFDEPRQDFREHWDVQYNQENEDEAQQIGYIECSTGQLSENPPPSEWLEDTLIELYLSGYPNSVSNAADDMLLPDDTNKEDGSMLTTNGDNKFCGQGEAELSLDQHDAIDTTAGVLYEDASWEEESWRAQYGQVVPQEEEPGVGFRIKDMWDWSMVREIQKEGITVARLVGRLVQPSSKLHPSMPSHGGRLRTAPICKAHLDLVQVRSGQVYKLRTPSARYITTLSSYDASNPTSDWGFPELSIEEIKETCVSKSALQISSQEYTGSGADKSSVYEKNKTHVYRDRASERRALHGSFGTAPGQKRSADDIAPSIHTEEAAAEALDMSLGAGSYAQKILKNMGWKEGEGLGKAQQGMKEPLQGIGNKGTAGLGWKSR